MADMSHDAPPRLPSLPRCTAVPLWRAPGVLQFGFTGRCLTLTGVPDAATRTIALMDGRHRLSDLVGDLDEEWTVWLLETLARHGLLSDGVPPVPRRWVRVVGTGRLARQVAEGLAEAGVGVRLLDQSADGQRQAQRTRRLVMDATAVEWDRVVVDPERRELADVDLTIVTGPGAEPDRLLIDDLMRNDHTHLTVRIHPDRAIVGPLVRPGSGSCLRCSDLARAARDPAWPHILVQLTRLPPAAPAACLRWASALAVTSCLARLAGRGTDVAGATVELPVGGGRIERRIWPTHPDCGCQVA